jgi:hypothetical protein
MNVIADASPIPTDPLSVDREPTDDELAAVMEDVARVAREKRIISDARLRTTLQEEVAAALTRMTYLRKQFKLVR